ncbi:MAG: hypothetical protein EAY68_02965 [Bacteroidetes bacterium]|nr:MAG: hypothetical protein EAY68_02965 [Bacteroidota bacterium]
MYKKFILLLTALLAISGVSFAQQADTTHSTPFVLTEEDSLAIMDSLKLELYDLLHPSSAKTSFADVQMGLGTGYFTLKNPTTNTIASQLYYQNQVGYYHKSGLFAQVRLLSTVDQGKLSLFQTSFNVGYQLIKPTYSVGFTYTYFSTNDSVSFYTSPLDHDFYLQAKYKKTWVRPSVGLGYSAGNQKTVLAQRLRTITTENFVRDFYLIVNFDHTFSFKWPSVKNFAVLLTPSLSFFSSTSNYGINRSVSNIPSFLDQRRQRQLAAVSGSQQQQEVFSLQSILGTLQTDVHYKAFNLGMQFTANYHAQKATTAFTPFFVCSVGYSF